MRRTRSGGWQRRITEGEVVIEFVHPKKNPRRNAILMPFELFDDEILKEISPIAGGNQGAVYTGRILHGNNEKPCVIKRIKKNKIPFGLIDSNTQEKKETLSRSHLLKNFNTHEFVTRDFESSADRGIIKLLYQCTRENGDVFAVFPYCDLFLNEHLKKNHHLNETEALKILTDLVSALSYLHEEKGMLHNDIKPDNIGFYQGKWCLFDLDCASMIGEKKPGSDGAFHYRCPRSFIFPDYGARTSNDIYALGCVMKEVLTGLFSSTETPSEFEKRIRNEYYQLKKVKQNTIQNDALSTMKAWIKKDKGTKASEMLNTLVDAMTNPNPFRRPTLNEIKRLLFLIKAKEPRVSAFDSIAAFFKINKPSEQPPFAGIPYAAENRFFGTSVFSQGSDQSDDDLAKKASS